MSDTKGSCMDGPRYVVSLQDPEDKCRYVDFFETEVFKDAKDEALDIALDELENKRATIIFDRKIQFIVLRSDPGREEEAEEQPVKKRRKTRK